MLWRAVVIWCLLMVGAIVNGALREKGITPLIGAPAGHVVSTVLLALLILAVTWVTIGWMAPTTAREALLIGTLWLVLTLAFEFGVGLFVSHRSWPEMLADYDLLKGRVWVVVPLITFLAPWWMAKARGLLHASLP